MAGGGERAEVKVRSRGSVETWSGVKGPCCGCYFVRLLEHLLVLSFVTELRDSIFWTL